MAFFGDGMLLYYFIKLSLLFNIVKSSGRGPMHISISHRPMLPELGGRGERLLLPGIVGTRVGGREILRCAQDDKGAAQDERGGTEGDDGQ